MAHSDRDDAAVERLRALIRIPTVSRTAPEVADETQFAAFRELLASLYPLTHAQLELELVGGGTLLFRWPGRGTGAPNVLMAHYDVVPADEVPAHSTGWAHGAFDAELAGDGDERRVWGRGAIDDKGMLAVILEAVEGAITDGFEPAADLYMSFGHNEETAGDGASDVVALFVERGIRPALVIDEGGAVVEGVFPGIDAPIAVVGVTEKGIAGVELSVEKKGGHAATPVRNGATSRLARAMLKLERTPARASISAPTLAMIRALAPHARQPLRFLFTQAGAFRGPLALAFARLGPETEAMVRTTRAVTRLTGSAGDNVIAERATAMVNVRIAVGSSLAQAVNDIQKAVDDPAVDVRLVYGSEPAPVSRSDGPVWQLLSDAITDTFPGSVVTPYVMLQASDSRHFAAISDGVYRFLPFDLTSAERGALHAIDESIRVSTYLRGIAFFRRLISVL
ncbi:MAG: M20/M25/M40 family metallo-hydrolase [Pseudolysinimonas sp.]